MIFVDSEPALLGRLQEGDPAALGEFYDGYSRLVYTLILRIVRDSATAEDLVQEIFLCLWKNAKLLHPERGSIGPWLLRVARNRAIDHLRSSDGRKQDRTSSLDRAAEPASTEVFHDRRAVIRAIQKLSSHQRLVIRLAYFDGYSHTEIAAKLGQPLGTVKTWMRNALLALRHYLVSPRRHTLAARCAA